MTVELISLAPLPDAPQTRAAAPFEVNLPGLFGRSTTTNYRIPSVREALGVPAVNRAVTLISNAGGALALRGLRDGIEDEKGVDRFKILTKPNPLSRPRTFWQHTFYHMATRGEAWWWVPQRDREGHAVSLFPVPPQEVKVDENQRDPRFPVITWRNQTMPNEDMVQLVLQPDPDNLLRGVGPLQMNQAAISVAVEADEWAANFYGEGGYPSLYLETDFEFESEDDAQKVKDKWVSNPPNMPQVLSPGLHPGTIPVNEQGAQMLQSRLHNRGEVANMFGIPGSLLEYTQSGASLTYQNVGQEFEKFVKSCLWPNYLEEVEQAISEELPRPWTAEFDIDRFVRPDPKTRYEIHQIAIGAGIYDKEEARAREGLKPGAPKDVTPPPPAVSPQEQVPVEQARSEPQTEEVRCDGMRLMSSGGIKQLKPCNKLLAEAWPAGTPYTGTCPRCKTEHGA